MCADKSDCSAKPQEVLQAGMKRLMSLLPFFLCPESCSVPNHIKVNKPMDIVHQFISTVRMYNSFVGCYFKLGVIFSSIYFSVKHCGRTDHPLPAKWRKPGS